MGGEWDDLVVIRWVDESMYIGKHLGEYGGVERIVWCLGMLVSLCGPQMEVEVLVCDKDVMPGEGAEFGDSEHTIVLGIRRVSGAWPVMVVSGMCAV